MRGGLPSPGRTTGLESRGGCRRPATRDHVSGNPRPPRTLCAATAPRLSFDVARPSGDAPMDSTVSLGGRGSFDTRATDTARKNASGKHIAS